MIQFNLLPDVKLQYIKAQSTRKVISLIAIVVTAASVGFFLIILSSHILKTTQSNKLTKDIDASSKSLKNQKEINKKLSVQNQLTSLTKLHDGKPAISRVFDYLNQVTPDKVVAITKFNIDYTLTTVTITGTADSLTSVNKYVDTLKFTTYTLADTTTATGEKPPKAFSGVVLTKFSYATPDTKSSSTNTDQPATYVIDLKYEPAIFDITKSIKLAVPSVTSTRSTVDQPTQLFRPEPVVPKQEGTR